VVAENVKVGLLGRLQAVKANAATVLQSVGLEGVYPVDPFEVADRLGIRLKFLPENVMARVTGSTGDVEGFCFEDGGIYYIAVGADWHSNAQRFTGAHELGHVIKHKELLPLPRNHSVRSSIEKEANSFAAQLLMPRDLVRKYGHLPLPVLARMFDVSPRAAQIRAASVL
jgi:Zn-dependent peptidase ImmA (M78 family)